MKLLNHENLSSKQFANLIGVQPSSVSHILSGRNKPSFDFIEKIVENYPRLNVEWLISGKGSMYKNKEEQNLFSGLQNQKDENKEPEPQITNVNSGVEPPKNIQKDKEAKHAAENNKAAEVQDKKNETGKGKKVKMIIVIYNDKTFSEYFPGE